MLAKQLRNVLVSAGMYALAGDQHWGALASTGNDAAYVQAVQNSLTRRVQHLVEQQFPGQGGKYDARFVRATGDSRDGESRNSGPGQEASYAPGGEMNYYGPGEERRLQGSAGTNDWASGYSYAVGSDAYTDGQLDSSSAFHMAVNSTVVPRLLANDGRVWPTAESASQWNWDLQPGLLAQPDYPYCCEPSTHLRTALDEQCDYLHSIEGFFICGITGNQTVSWPTSGKWPGVGEYYHWTTLQCHPGNTFVNRILSTDSIYRPFWAAADEIQIVDTDSNGGVAGCQRMCRATYQSKVFMYRTADGLTEDYIGKCLCASSTYTISDLVNFEKNGGATAENYNATELAASTDWYGSFQNVKYDPGTHEPKDWVICDTEVEVPRATAKPGKPGCLGQCVNSGTDSFGECQNGYCGTDASTGGNNFCCTKTSTDGGCLGWVGSEDASGRCVPPPSVAQGPNNMQVAEVFEKVVRLFSWFLDANQDGAVDKTGVSFALGCNYAFVFGERGEVASIATPTYGNVKDYVVYPNTLEMLREVPARFPAQKPVDSKFNAFTIALEHRDPPVGFKFGVSDSEWRPTRHAVHGGSNSRQRFFVFWGPGQCTNHGGGGGAFLAKKKGMGQNWQAASVDMCADWCYATNNCELFEFFHGPRGLSTDDVSGGVVDPQFTYGYSNECTLYSAAHVPGGDCMERYSWNSTRVVYKLRGSQSETTKKVAATLAPWADYRFVKGINADAHCGQSQTLMCSSFPVLNATCTELSSSASVANVDLCKAACDGDPKCNFFSFKEDDGGADFCSTYDACPVGKTDSAFSTHIDIGGTKRIITLNKNLALNSTEIGPFSTNTWAEYDAVGEHVFNYIARAFDKIGFLRFDIPGYTLLNTRRRYVKTPSTKSLMELFATDAGYSTAASEVNAGFCANKGDADYLAQSCYGTDTAVVEWCYQIWLFAQNSAKAYDSRVNSIQVKALNDMTFAGFPLTKYPGAYAYDAWVPLNATAKRWLPSGAPYLGIRHKAPNFTRTDSKTLFNVADLCNEPYDFVSGVERARLIHANPIPTPVLPLNVDPNPMPPIQYVVLFFAVLAVLACMGLYCMWKVWKLACRCCCAACLCCCYVTAESDDESSDDGEAKRGMPKGENIGRLNQQELRNKKAMTARWKKQNPGPFFGKGTYDNGKPRKDNDSDNTSAGTDTSEDK